MPLKSNVRRHEEIHTRAVALGSLDTSTKRVHSTSFAPQETYT